MVTRGVDFSTFLVVTSCALFFFDILTVCYGAAHLQKNLIRDVFNRWMVV